MATKPSYLGTLNAIANGERGGYELFRAWSAATSDANLKKTLDTVAVREMEHSWAFEKRINELGYTVEPTDNKALKKLVRMMKSKASDAEKFASFGIGATNSDKAAPDQLLQILADKTIDPVTGALVGRFICEERDSGKLLVNAYQAMQRRGKRVKKKAA